MPVVFSKQSKETNRIEVRESAVLRFLYHTLPGRVFLRFFASRGLSRLVATYMDSSLSRSMISSFVEKNAIDMKEYQEVDPMAYPDFNSFFTREIRPELRPIDKTPNHLISPCDGLLSVYPITTDTVLPIKQSAYTITDLLQSDNLSALYDGGLCLVFRLCVNHYHRYCYLDSGREGESRFIPGKLHTVRPIALASYPVFTQNSREYTLLHTDHFGAVAQVEVGAMLIGKIKNHHRETPFTRGQEKGMFLYGGSTIVLLLEPKRAAVFQEFLDRTRANQETPVKMGQKIGEAIFGDRR
ncbi:MAG: phosphatidylserine decarboxylase [Firmicutes bacterium]|nr:phosphatidylserine decarboxylase [Bacillota bacterium]